ncbi:hypothetical protein [Streptomyces sp. SYSU K217416]
MRLTASRSCGDTCDCGYRNEVETEEALARSQLLAERGADAIARPTLSMDLIP